MAEQLVVVLPDGDSHEFPPDAEAQVDGNDGLTIVRVLRGHDGTPRERAVGGFAPGHWEYWYRGEPMPTVHDPHGLLWDREGHPRMPPEQVDEALGPLEGDR